MNAARYELSLTRLLACGAAALARAEEDGASEDDEAALLLEEDVMALEADAWASEPEQAADDIEVSFGRG